MNISEYGYNCFICPRCGNVTEDVYPEKNDFGRTNNKCFMCGIRTSYQYVQHYSIYEMLKIWKHIDSGLLQKGEYNFVTLPMSSTIIYTPFYNVED